jgi:hypothetical protein
MRRVSIAAGLAISCVAFVALLGAEPNPSRYEICDPGYSRSHRMPYPESSAIKRRMVPYGHSMSEYELDHIVPLCLGGSNNSSNLMLQPWPEARQKDRLEIFACRKVCEGSMSLETGRNLFVDWRQGYFDMFGERP